MLYTIRYPFYPCSERQRKIYQRRFTIKEQTLLIKIIMDYDFMKTSKIKWKKVQQAFVASCSDPSLKITVQHLKQVFYRTICKNLDNFKFIPKPVLDKLREKYNAT